MSEQVEVVAHILVETARRHGVTVIRVEGEIDMQTCDEVRAEVIDRLAEAPEVLVLDLTGVTFFGSVGLSMLIEARHRAELRGIRFAVAADQRAVLGPMTETGIDGLVVLRADVPEAAEAARTQAAA